MHLLRKYTNNRGSALFMVISTMTAVMVSCMAMYFSVVSSRSTQYAIFNQQQSKSSAESIADAILAGIMEGNSQLVPILNDIQKLAVGEKLTTNGNDFIAFSTSGTKEDDQNLGAYMVEITKLSDTSFDIIITSSVNGVNSVKHTIVEYSVEEGGSNPAAPTQIFAATGYVPNDVYLEGGNYHSDMFYDNELTILDAYEGIDAHVTGDFAIGGSILNVGGMFPMGDKPVVYSIRNTYTSETSTVSTFPSGSKMLVGGDLVLNKGGGFANVDVYVLGDMYVFSNGLASDNCHFFVDGNVYMHKDIGTKESLFNVNGQYIYIEGNGSSNAFTKTGKLGTVEKWNNSVGDSGYMDPDSMLDELKARTATNTYYKWIINDTLPKKEIVFSHGSNPVSVVELKYSATEKGCEITNIKFDKEQGRQFTDHAIIIDTGDDPNNIYTIRVNGLYDMDYNKTKETFMWYPYSAMDESVRMNILVKGRGSVVIDVPKGVVYQDISKVKFMHYNWWLICGGKVKTQTVNGKDIQIYDTNGWIGGDMEKTLSGLIHTKCNSDCACEYSEVKSKSKCTTHPEENLIEVHCTVHELIGTYCPTCFPSFVGKDVDHTGDCKLRVGRKEIDAYLAKNSDLKKAMEVDDEGKMIYPTTNIYLVSCEESAEFRFSQLKESINIVKEWVTSVDLGGKKTDSDGVEKYYVTLKCRTGKANDIADLIKGKDYNFVDNIVVDGDKVIVFVEPYYNEWTKELDTGYGGNFTGWYWSLKWDHQMKQSVNGISYDEWKDGKKNKRMDDDGVEKYYVTLKCKTGTADWVANYINSVGHTYVDNVAIDKDDNNTVIVYMKPDREVIREYQDGQTKTNAETLVSQFKKLQDATSGGGIDGNAFFGYVYAPYMTFKGYGNGSGGGWVRMMGGMTVSDYILDDSYSTIACWPERMPTDLMSDESKKNAMAGFSTQSWKITPQRHG